MPILFYKSTYHAKRQQTSAAITSVQEAHRLLETAVFNNKDERDEAQKLIDLNSWNAGCMLLKTSQFETAEAVQWGLRCLQLVGNVGSVRLKRYSLISRLLCGVVSRCAGAGFCFWRSRL